MYTDAEFIISTPCDFINIDEAADIIVDALEPKFKRRAPISIGAEFGTFTTGRVSIYMDRPNTIQVSVDMEYTGDRGEDEDEFIRLNSAIFAEFIEQVRLDIADAVADTWQIAELPDAYVVLIPDNGIFVQVDSRQNHLRLDWQAPTVYSPENLDYVLSDIFFSY